MTGLLVGILVCDYVHECMLLPVFHFNHFTMQTKIKVITLNVRSIRTAVRAQAVRSWLASVDADILCL